MVLIVSLFYDFSDLRLNSMFNALLFVDCESLDKMESAESEH